MKKRVILYFVMIFLLIGCYSGEGGCSKPNAIKVFPIEEITIDEDFEVIIGEIGTDDRIKHTVYYDDSTIQSIGDEDLIKIIFKEGSEYAKIEKNILKPLSSGKVKLKVKIQDSENKLETESQDIIINKEIKKNLIEFNLMGVADFVFEFKDKIYVLSSKILNQNEIENGEYGINVIDMDGRIQDFIKMDRKDIKYIFSNEINKIYILTEDKMYSYNEKFELLSEKDITPSFQRYYSDNIIVSYTYGYKIEVMYIDINKIDIIEENPNIYFLNNKIFTWNTEMNYINLKIYDLKKNIEINKSYTILDSNELNGNITLAENQDEIILSYNSNKNKYPGFGLMLLDKNTYNVKKEFYIAGYSVKNTYFYDEERVAILAQKSFHTVYEKYDENNTLIIYNLKNKKIEYISTLKYETKMLLKNKAIIILENDVDERKMRLRKFELNLN